MPRRQLWCRLTPDFQVLILLFQVDPEVQVQVLDFQVHLALLALVGVLLVVLLVVLLEALVRLLLALLVVVWAPKEVAALGLL